MVEIRDIWLERGHGTGWSASFNQGSLQLEVEPWIQGYRLKFGEELQLSEYEFGLIEDNINRHVEQRILEVEKTVVADIPEIEIPQAESPVLEVKEEITRKEIKPIVKKKTKVDA